jgi:hypothetical protein
MDKYTRRQNQNTNLEALVTDEARRQAESHGIPLASFISGIAMKSETMPITIRVRMADIDRINSLFRGESVHQWVEKTVRDVLECYDGEVSNSNGAKKGLVSAQ